MPDCGATIPSERPRAPAQEPLRLAFVSHALNASDQRPASVGGLERAAADLLAALRRRPDVEVIPITEAAMTDPLRFAAFSLSALRRVRRLARDGSLDAVLFSAMPTAWMGAVLAPLLRERSVTSAAVCHGHDVIMGFAPYQRLVRRTLSALDAVMPVSRATGARCLERGAHPDRLHVIPNGVDAGRYAPAPLPAARRAILAAAFPDEAAGLGPEDLLIVSVGRQVARKGHAWFVREVMPLLAEGARLWLAGEGPEATAIEAAARAGGLEGRVLRLGPVPEGQLAALYRGADLFVMPNLPTPGDMEGFGLVLLEAALNGLPALAADLEGMADVIVDGVDGRLVPPQDAAAFAAAITGLAADPAGRARLARAAETKARTRFSWDAVAARHVGVLRRYQSCHPNLAVIEARQSQLEAPVQHVIKVAPAHGGWELRNGSGQPLLFESSAQAVWSARKLGETLAEGGTTAEVQVIQKDGSLAGRYLCQPAAVAELELN